MFEMGWRKHGLDSLGHHEVPPNPSNTLAIIHWFVDTQDIGTWLGHSPRINSLIQLCCWVGCAPTRTNTTNQDIPSKKLKLCQVSVRFMYRSPGIAGLQQSWYLYHLFQDNLNHITSWSTCLSGGATFELRHGGAFGCAIPDGETVVQTGGWQKLEEGSTRTQAKMHGFVTR